MLQFKISNTGERLKTAEGEQFGVFVNGLSARVSIPVDRLVLSTGFPPLAVFGEPEEPVHRLLQSGVIMAREGVPPSVKQRGGQPPPQQPEQPLQQQQPQSSAADHGSVATLVAMGFDRNSAERAVEIAGDDLGLAVEVCQELSASHSHSHGSSSSSSSSSAAVPAALPKTRRIARRVIDADNSCLFNAVGYLMVRDRKQMNAVYRDLVATEIRENPTQYTSDILEGKTPEEYVAWVRNPEKWGGEIELDILARKIGVEIAALDVLSGQALVYGQGRGFTDRIYVLYDGVHYDAIVSALEDGAGGSHEDDDVTSFSVDDVVTMEHAKSLAADLKKKKQFVNLAGCDLQCLVCKTGLKGQAGAQAHAKETGHQNFAAV
jgi:ubiquitin thioesterase OTU1